MFEKKNILGVGITNSTKGEILEYILKSLAKKRKKLFIITPNPEILMHAARESEYKDILNGADLALADGVGLIVAGKVLGESLKGRVTGVEILEDLCSHVAEKPITVGFLGGGYRVAEMTAECLLKKHPKLRIVFAGEEWGRDGRRWKVENSILKIEDRKSIHPQISTFKNLPSTFHHPPSKIIDILFVAFGAPKQEIWISQNLDKLPVGVAIGVGGAFDYISGRVPRAPVFIRVIGFEWLFRLVIQPWRLKRQLALLEFAYLVLKEKISQKSVI